MLRVDLGPVTEVRETTKGQVRHRLREQRKVRRLRSFLKEKGRLLTTFEVLESELRKSKLRLTMELTELLTR